ncbi:hypothetical protein, partial [Rhodopirellula europaea]|uniref:hypothetical protein n=1 Tax=Rhodopirellula europaea TaxID=1263866 RepID=UPI0007C7E211
TVLLIKNLLSRIAMNTKRRRLLRIASVAAMVGLASVGFLYSQIEKPQPVTQLEIAVARMPLGITAEDADRVIGSSPDAVEDGRAILVNPVMMFSGSSVQGQKYGDPNLYSFRTWTRGDVHASVAIDTDGKVAARWTYRDQPN